MKFRDLVALPLVCSALFAQTGGINGIVMDQTQAVISGARVAITNLDTGLRREVETNDTGSYSAPLLPVGRYRIEARKEGFGTRKSKTKDVVGMDHLAGRTARDHLQGRSCGNFHAQVLASPWGVYWKRSCGVNRSRGRPASLAATKTFQMG